MCTLFLQGIHDIGQISPIMRIHSFQARIFIRHGLVSEHLHAFPLQILLVVGRCEITYCV